jgi:hypothetical protein
VNNQFTMQFTEVPMPDGSVTVPGGGGITGYSVDVVYKREVRTTDVALSWPVPARPVAAGRLFG